MRFVLDSWAVLALLEGAEPAAARVQEVLERHRPVMSWINAGEVYYVIHRRKGQDEAHDVVRELRSVAALELPTERRVLEAAALKAEHPMAYADAFAAATALAHGAALLTGDPELLNADVAWSVVDLRR